MTTIEMVKQQIIKETNEFKGKLVLANKFIDLDVYVGDYNAYMELGSIAACVTQIDRPFIFLADSKTLTKFRLNKNEIRGILYHELAHYKLGHTDMDYILNTDMTTHLYKKQELDADAMAVELAVQDGLNIENALLTMAISLAKSAMYIMQENLEKNTLPSQECMEFMQERVDALLNRLSNKDAFIQKINKFKKESATSMTKIANKKGYRNVDELVESIQMNDVIDIDKLIAETQAIQYNEPVYEIDQALLDSIVNMDVEDDDEDLSVYEMFDNIDDLLNTIC
jgi:hypothetical protein